MHDVAEGERERRVGPGERLQMQVGRGRRRRRDRIDDDDRGGRFGQPVLVLMRRRGRRIRAPDQDAARVDCRLRVESVARGTVEIGQRLVPGLVADRVGVDLRRAEPMEEPLRECRSHQSARARVVRIQDRLRPVRDHDLAEPGGDFADRLVPRDRLEPSCTLRAAPAERAGEARLGVPEDTVVGDRALRAQLAAAHMVLRVAAHMPQPSVADRDEDATGVVTVARARRPHEAIAP